MICRVNHLPFRVQTKQSLRSCASRVAALIFALLIAPLLSSAQQKQVKPIAGPRATALRVTDLFVSPDKTAQRVDRVQIGREMVVAERSGPWLRVYANTDIVEEHERD